MDKIHNFSVVRLNLASWSLNVEKIILTKKEQKVTQLLLRYMRNHPEAKHTAEGIARWWILQQKFEEELNLVEKLIAYFTSKGILEKIYLPDGNVHYKVQPEKIKIDFIKE